LAFRFLEEEEEKKAERRRSRNEQHPAQGKLRFAYPMDF
jgi:hypothetical protein